MSGKRPIATFAGFHPSSTPPRFQPSSGGFSIGFHPNDRMVLLTYPDRFEVCSTATGEKVWGSRFEKGVFGAVFAEDGASVVACVGPEERLPPATPASENVLVRVTEDEGRRPLEIRASAVLGASPDGAVALVHYGDGELGLVDLHALTERPRFVLAERGAPHWLLRFGAISRGGAVAVTSTRRGVPDPPVATIQVWHTSGSAHGRMGNAAGIGPVAVSPNGRYALYGSARNAVLWNVEAGGIEAPMSVDALAHDVSCVDFERDGRRYLYGGGDRIEVVRRLPGKTSASLLHEPLGNARTELVAARFSHDGRRVLTAATDGRLFLWDLS